jgi:hypothetical protein
MTGRRSPRPGRPDNRGRVASDDRLRSNIATDHRAGANHSTCTDPHSLENDRAGPDEHVVLNIHSVSGGRGRKFGESARRARRRVHRMMVGISDDNPGTDQNPSTDPDTARRTDRCACHPRIITDHDPRPGQYRPQHAWPTGLETVGRRTRTQHHPVAENNAPALHQSEERPTEDTHIPAKDNTRASQRPPSDGIECGTNAALQHPPRNPWPISLLSCHSRRVAEGVGAPRLFMRSSASARKRRAHWMFNPLIADGPEREGCGTQCALCAEPTRANTSQRCTPAKYAGAASAESASLCCSWRRSSHRRTCANRP